MLNDQTILPDPCVTDVLLPLAAGRSDQHDSDETSDDHQQELVSLSM